MNSAPEVLVDEIKPNSMPETTSGDVGGVEDLEINAPVDAASSGGSGAPAESTGSVTVAAAASGEGITAEDLLPNPIGSPDSAPPMKGYGLKKWRRIRRDSGSDAAVGVDSGMILKRRLSLPEPVKARDDNSKQKNDADDAEGEGSIASNTQVAATVAIVGTGALDPELELLVASGGFSVGADSDNSEDRSSKSSTAASAPRTRHEMAGYARERSKGKGSGGRGSGHAMQQRSQRGRGGGGMDASKKFRADQLKFYKENSQSSVESDLRS